MRRLHPALALAGIKGAYIVAVAIWLGDIAPWLPWLIWPVLLVSAHWNVVDCAPDDDAGQHPAESHPQGTTTRRTEQRTMNLPQDILNILAGWPSASAAGSPA